MKVTYQINLSVEQDEDDVELDAILATALREAAQVLYSQTLMIASRNKPVVSITRHVPFEAPAPIQLYAEDSDDE